MVLNLQFFSKYTLFKTIISSLLLFLFDQIWFSFFDYSQIITKKVNLFSALLSWILLGLSISILFPKNIKQSIIYTLFLALFIYGVFNLTNFAINKDFSLKISVFDTLWGCFNMTINGIILFLLFHKK